MEKNLDIVIIGLSITSSWGNGHATTFRGLVRQLHKKGHNVTFFEQDVPWYASHRDLPQPDYCKVVLYNAYAELQEQHKNTIQGADVVIVGSYVQDGVAVGNLVCSLAQGVKCFYDIDTPVTLSRLEQKDFLYLEPELIKKYDLYLSFTGGPTLDFIESAYGSPAARPLYCSFDPEIYFPQEAEQRWDLGYLGTYSEDRQPPLDRLMLDAARQYPEGRFMVAGPQYPEHILWPANVERTEHLPPSEHRAFYNAQRFTMNITRADMIQRGYSPSVRLFEAAACATPVISDFWEGLSTFFLPSTEILIAESAEDTLKFLTKIDEAHRREIGLNAMKRVLAEHTAAHRAAELENYLHAMITSSI